MLLVSVASAVWACTVPQQPLPTVDLPPACRGIGIEGRLVGLPSDPRLAFLLTDQGLRIDLVWPPGYTARFAPELEVLSDAGAVMFRHGDRPRGGCIFWSPDGTEAVILIQE